MAGQKDCRYLTYYRDYTLFVWVERDGWHCKVEKPQTSYPGPPQKLTYDGPTVLKDVEDAKPKQ